MQNEKVAVTLKKIAVVSIVVVTFGVFIYYLATHPKLLNTITTLNPGILVLLTIGYTLFTIVNSIVLFASLKFLSRNVSFLENILLTGYSSIVNFFGPLQSGPGFRAIYLKKRHNVSFKDFIITSLIFYLFFALINSLILTVAAVITLSLIPLLVAITVGLVVLFVASSILKKRQPDMLNRFLKKTRLHNPYFWLIGLGALALCVVTTLTYWVELYHVNPSVTAAQAMVYTSAANLSLFVSLTPGAIGFREAFLLLSEQLHHIPQTTIIGASVIDRAFYVMFLLILFVILLIVNSRKRLGIIGTKSRE